MRALALAGLVFILPATAHEHEHRPSIQQMGYLTGDWIQTADGVTTEEHWIGPVGGVMTGVTITHSEKPGFQTRVEFMSIVERDGTLVYIARPGPQAPTEFTLEESDNGFATFQNAGHDFPQRITYTIGGENFDELTATIQGERNGAAREMTWRYRRAEP